MKLVSEDDRAWLAKKENKFLFELYVSYLEARKGGKRKTFDEHKFEVNEFENLMNLRDSILNKTYRPSPGSAHVIHHPVIREIFAASFRDRIVHHWMYAIVGAWWDKYFIADSYSCRTGKGTKYAIDRLARHIQSASDNYRKKVWVIKLDIKSYFMSMIRQKLYERAMWGLNLQFKDHKGWKYETMRFLWGQIIFDDPCKGVKRKGWPKAWRNLPKHKSLFNQLPGIGIVIGNLTSQLLSNIFLDQLDRYVKIDLNYKHYGRYVDDFYIVVEEKELDKALKDIEAIRRFLKRMGLTLHPNKQRVQPASRGVEFLGAVVYPGRIYPGKRLKRNAAAAFRDVAAGKKDIDSIVSYLGHMKYMKADGIIREIAESTGIIDIFSAEESEEE